MSKTRGFLLAASVSLALAFTPAVIFAQSPPEGADEQQWQQFQQFQQMQQQQMQQQGYPPQQSASLQQRKKCQNFLEKA
jgi:hypothetical protein